MPRGYTEREIRNAVTESLDSNPHFLYQQGFLNYQGKTTDSCEPYVEVISEELLRNFSKLKEVGAGVPIRRTKSFNTLHNGIPNVKARLKRFGDLTFSEKLLAIAIFNSKSDYCLGKIFDYQVPLKEHQKDRFGELDLVAQAGSSIKILELKINGKSQETLLRAIIEVYTYYMLLKGSLEKFIADFNLGADSYFQPCILTDRFSLSGQTILNFDNFPETMALVSKIGDEIGVPLEFYLFSYSGQKVRTNETHGKVELDGEIKIFQAMRDLTAQAISPLHLKEW